MLLNFVTTLAGKPETESVLLPGSYVRALAGAMERERARTVRTE